MISWQLKIYVKNNDIMTIKNIYKKQWYHDN